MNPTITKRLFNLACLFIREYDFVAVVVNQFKVGKLGGTRANMTEIWRAALAA